MDPELRQVSIGCELRIASYGGYDVNGYCFHTKSHEQSRANRRTTNSGVCSTGTGGKDYYGIVEEICQLTFPGCKPLKPILFKCHWFDPDQTQETKDVGPVEIRQSSVMSTLWLNRPRKCIISHTRAKPTNVYRVGTLCTRYRHTVDYLSQTMKTTT
jgi:hypothetical protein